MRNRKIKRRGLGGTGSLSYRRLAAVATACVALGLGGTALLDWVMDRPTAIDATRVVPVESFVPPEVEIARDSAAPRSDLAWTKNAVPFSLDTAKPHMAIIVVDEGRDPGAVAQAISIDVPLSLAILPSSDGARERAKAARAQQRELLALLPMEPENAFNTTPNPIASHVGREELLRRIAWNLAKLDGYVGAINQHGEAVSRDATTMRTVMEVMQSRGSLFIDARTHPDSVAGAVARRMGVPAGDSNIAIDSEATANEVRDGLAAGANHARLWGDAIVTIPAERVAIDALKQWLRKRKTDIALAPVSAVVARLRTGGS